MSKLSWTQPACKPCYEKTFTGPAPIVARDDRPGEFCVYCGTLTADGLFVHIDPSSDRARHPTRLTA